MTLEELKKKLKEGYFVVSDKDSDKIVEIRRFYEKTFDWQTNYARFIYDVQFDSLCREAKKQKRDLWEFLSSDFMYSDVRHLIKPPDKLKHKKEEQEFWIKNQYMQYFYEFYINHRSRPIEHAFHEGLLKFRGGGKHTAEITNPRSVARKAPIRKERKKLIDSGVKEKDVLSLLVKKLTPLVKKFSKRPYYYIQQTNIAERKQEADKRRRAKTGF